MSPQFLLPFKNSSNAAKYPEGTSNLTSRQQYLVPIKFRHNSVVNLFANCSKCVPFQFIGHKFAVNLCICTTKLKYPARDTRWIDSLAVGVNGAAK